MPHSSVTGDAKRRILVVDDSRAIQAIIRRVLEAPELGEVELLFAADGQEALDKVHRYSPDLVLSDWHMPGVSGIEMLQTLRQTGQTEVPVGFVTTESSEQCRQEAQLNGAAFVLNKPFQDVALREAVLKALGVRQQLQAASAPEVDVLAAARALASQGQKQQGPVAVESLAQLQQILFAQTGARSFDLRRSEQPDQTARQLPQLISLYSSAGRSGAYALGVLDLSACCLIGGTAAGSTTQEIQQAVQQGQPSAKMVDHATRFLRASAAVLRKRSPTDAPSLSAARLATQPFDKLERLLLQNNGRSEFQLALPGAGEGRMSFLLV